MIEEKNNSINQNVEILQIKKTPEIIEALRERKFSPSSLKIYNQCPLQFYLKYVAKHYEPEELAEELDAAVLDKFYIK
ncbi:MAG: PD-(D/E)XK nuclease family protein [Saprospirales bacterium]|nr:PD-(D/E)XK nuclease family protein [Saprospirales bacterium]